MRYENKMRTLTVNLGEKYILAMKRILGEINENNFSELIRKALKRFLVKNLSFYTELDDNSSTKITSVNLPEEYLEGMKILSDKKAFFSMSEVVREAIRDYVREYAYLKNNPTKTEEDIKDFDDTMQTQLQKIPNTVPEFELKTRVLGTPEEWVRSRALIGSTIPKEMGGIEENV